MKPISILNWSQITSDNENFYPVFFFTPTIELLTWIHQYGYHVVLKIEGSQVYDGVYRAYFQIANLDQPNQTLDFKTTAPVYSALLDTPFTIYPCSTQKGIFTIALQSDTPPIKEDYLEEIPLNDETEIIMTNDLVDKNTNGEEEIIVLNNNSTNPANRPYCPQKLRCLLYIIFSLFVLCFILFFISLILRS